MDRPGRPDSDAGLRSPTGYPRSTVDLLVAADVAWRRGYARIVVPVSTALTTGALIVAVVAESLRH